MTTIACDMRSMAGDGQTHRDGMIVRDDAVKVRILDDGTLFGAAGTASMEHLVIAWWFLAEPRPKCEAAKDVNALFLTPEGRLWFLGDCGYLTEHTGPTAIGSGMEYALAVMTAGLSAEKALWVASKLDPSTGGRITIVRQRGDKA